MESRKERLKNVLPKSKKERLKKNVLPKIGQYRVKGVRN